MQQPKRVVIINGGIAYHKMFEMYGWDVVQSLEDADLVQFTGGEDVSPALYHETAHPATSWNYRRDFFEKEVYLRARSMNLPCTGICRGGQFLNVMNGGKMYQHVNKHGIAGTHKAVDLRSGATLQVSSTHHQMMRPAASGEVLCIANLSTSKEHMTEENVEKQKIIRVDGTEENDVEVVLYKDTDCLCFQPHPEFVVHSEDYRECADYYFECLKEVV